MIPFNKPPYIGVENNYITCAISNNKICGDGEYTKKCQSLMCERFNIQKTLLTTSGTTALEMAAILSEIKPGDEVILPSFTFSSTANAFVLVGTKLVFVDIRPDTMNIDEELIEQAITEKTRVICAVHYAGVSCNMDKICAIAEKHGLIVVEDAAQAVMSTYKGKQCGTFGDFGCFSFHETKNYSMGEGGAILINSSVYNEKAEIIREKGTNRSVFLRGQVDKYTWVDYGSSYLPSELNAAYLFGQLENADKINDYRLAVWSRYYCGLSELAENGDIKLPYVPDDCKHNAHMFYIKCKDIEERTAFIEFMKQNGVICTFHYVPLHSAPAGIKFGKMSGCDRYTTAESNRLVRLPMYYGLTDNEADYVIEQIHRFYKNKKGECK